jgi:hypothetical protein
MMMMSYSGAGRTSSSIDRGAILSPPNQSNFLGGQRGGAGIEHERKVSQDIHAQKNAISNHDLDYFEQMILQFQEDLSKPLMQRRQNAMKDDLVEEIHDLYNEIKDNEKNFKKVLEITCKEAVTNFSLIFF